MTVEKLISQTQVNPESIIFNDVIATIEDAYTFTETEFKNGKVTNKAGENTGSCKVFSFAKLQGLNQAQTLALFGQYYQDVLSTPEGSDHQNIRQFMQNGHAGLDFSGNALCEK